MSRRVLELHSALSSLKEFELLSYQQDNLNVFSKLLAKTKFPPLFLLYFDVFNITQAFLQIVALQPILYIIELLWMLFLSLLIMIPEIMDVVFGDLIFTFFSTFLMWFIIR